MIGLREGSVIAVYPSNQPGFSIAASKPHATPQENFIFNVTDDGLAFGANLCITHACCSQVHITEHWVWPRLLSAETELEHTP